MDLFDLRGSVAAVIGGTGVLGGALCHGLGAAGAAVAVMGRSSERAEERRAALERDGVAAAAVLVDATDRASLEAAAGPGRSAARAGRHPGQRSRRNSATPFFDIGLDEWHRIIDANLTSVFLACQVFGRAMADRGTGGSIINISSASSGPPLSRVATYSIAKAGVNNLTQYLARELAPRGVRVNAIARVSSQPSRTGRSCPKSASGRSSGTRRRAVSANPTS